MMERVSIHSISEFLSIYKKFQLQFGMGPYLFRGVRDSNWQHIPLVFRKFLYSQKDDSSRKIQVSGAIYLTSENEILEHFLKESYSLCLGFSRDDRAMGLQFAQHYGVPTRLLDFTDNPLVALFFCCHELDDSEGYISLIHYKNFMQWSFSEQEFRRKTRKEVIEHIVNDQIYLLKECDNPKLKPILITPSYIDQRMSAQSSRFMLWGESDNSLEEMIAENNYMILSPDNTVYYQLHDERFFSKIFVDKNAKRSIMEELELMNINEKTIFPGLDGIGKYIERKYRRSPDNFSSMPLVN